MEKYGKKLVVQDLVKGVKDLLVIRNDDGSYNLFGKYNVMPTQEGFFKVETTDLDEHLIFSNLKYAVTWCVFAKHNKSKDIKRIQELDTYISSIDVAIAQHKKMILKSNLNDEKDIYFAKLFEEKIKKSMMLKELDLYVKTSKSWQSNKYDESSSKF